MKSNDLTKDHGEVDFHQRKEAQRKAAARRPVSEKIAAVLRLRDFERTLEKTRKANRAKRAAKQITIKIDPLKKKELTEVTHGGRGVFAH